MIYFIADFFSSELKGGAEFCNEAIIRYIEQRAEVVCMKSEEISLEFLKTHLDDFFMVANFCYLSEEVKYFFITELEKKYIIIEHDHKYTTYNVADFPNFLIPSTLTKNSFFYKNAKAVFVQTRIHAEVMQKNLLLTNIINLSGNCWTEEHIACLEQNINKQKNIEAAVVLSKHNNKGTHEAVEYCKKNNLCYELLPDSEYEIFIKKLARVKKFVFLPRGLETFSRVTVEAKILGCELIINKLIGVASEDFLKTTPEKVLDHIKKLSNSIPNMILKVVNGETPEFFKSQNGSQEQNEGEIHPRENCFKIVIPLYNTEKWIRTCINSVKNQTYQNYECILIDDLSTDNSQMIILDEIENNNKFRIITNSEKKYALQNIYEGVRLLAPKDEDIIVVLDGDDWFANNKVLDLLNKAYGDDCLITYGNYIEYPTSIVGRFCKKIPAQIRKTRDFRDYDWCTSHLRTFKYKLWKNIKISDLKDKAGNFYRMAWDLAFMFPMLEMSGDNFKFIEDIMYVYNVHNPLNDHKIDPRLQMALEKEIRNRKPYSVLKENKI